jgi:FKBP-type peptidyl-prolyl cis-trans isomerase
MRFLPLVACLFCLAAEDAAAPAAGEAAAKPADPLQDQASYLIGRDIGGKVAGVVAQYGLDKERFLIGLRSAIDGAPSEIPEEQAKEVFQQFQAKQQADAETKAKKDAEEAPKRKERNAAFLAEHTKQKGVVVTASGLQYEVLAAGSGRSPKSGQQVKVTYTGTLLDGTVFDASSRHGGSATFAVGQLIKGWNEALLLMKEGDKWRLTVPSELAYGEQAPPNIGNNQVLVFELELLEVVGQ